MSKSYYELINDIIEGGLTNARKRDELEKAIEVQKRLEQRASKAERVYAEREKEKKLVKVLQAMERSKTEAKMKKEFGIAQKIDREQMKSLEAFINGQLERFIGLPPNDAADSVRAALENLVKSATKDRELTWDVAGPSMVYERKKRKLENIEWMGDWDDFGQKPMRKGVIEFPLYAGCPPQTRPEEKIGKCRLAALTATRLDEGEIGTIALIEEQKARLVPFDAENVEAITDIYTRKIHCQVWRQSRSRFFDWRIVVESPEDQWLARVSENAWLG